MYNKKTLKLSEGEEAIISLRASDSHGVRIVPYTPKLRLFPGMVLFAAANGEVSDQPLIAGTTFTLLEPSDFAVDGRWCTSGNWTAQMGNEKNVRTFYDLEFLLEKGILKVSMRNAPDGIVLTIHTSSQFIETDLKENFGLKCEEELQLPLTKIKEVTDAYLCVLNFLHRPVLNVLCPRAKT